MNPVSELERLLLQSANYRDPAHPEVSGLEHAMQTATRAKRAKPETEWPLIGLLHDVAKPLSELWHGEIIALTLKEYVSPEGYCALYDHGAVNRMGHLRCSQWNPTTLRFCQWDTESFEPNSKTEPLEFWIRYLRGWFINDVGRSRK